MLAFQSYNVKSPLNGRAARWVEENLRRLPVDKGVVFMDLDENAPAETTDGQDTCANCGVQSVPFVRCSEGHGLCSDCVARCERCGSMLCLACGTVECSTCAPAPCSNCGARSVDAGFCEAGHLLCGDCRATCDSCGRTLCLICGEFPCPRCQPATPTP